MLVLKATHKVLKTLPLSVRDTDASDTALGDWYVNRIVIDRQPLLLSVSSTSLLSMVTPAQDVKNLPQWFPRMVADRLERLGVVDGVLRGEMGAMDIVRVGRTEDRSVIGQMVDFARAIPYYRPEHRWDDATLRLVEDRLSEIPCRSSRRYADVVFPRDTAVRLLTERWSILGSVN